MTFLNDIKSCYQYAEDVRSGKILAGRYVKLAAERYYRDRENEKKKGIYIWDERAAQKALAFFELLCFTKGRWKGHPFKLEPWQCFIVANIFGWKRKSDGLRRYTEAYVEIPKKNGKALCLETLIPTPSGWRRMGDLQPGDQVFDETGTPCNVTFATDVMYDRNCYEVEFSDGIKVIADEEHLWETMPYRTGRPCRKDFKGGKRADWSNLSKKMVFTTKQIKETLYFEQGKRKEKVANHRIPNSLPVHYAEKPLPIHPYILGCWLGDGNSRDARITVSDNDLEILDHLKKLTPVREYKSCRQSSCSDYGLGDGCRKQSSRNISITAKLRKLNLLNNKHIPSIYLESSVEQRTELLKGLMDTDGYASKAGQCEFTTTSKPLYEGFMELARSLGYKPSVKRNDSKFAGRLMGKKYRVQFWSFKKEPCFKLQRKVDRLKDCDRYSKRSNFRQIVSVTQIPSVPVKCIQVDSPSRLYLCSEGFIPTHNTELAAGIALLMLLLDGEPGAEVYAAAYTRDQANICFKGAKSMAKQSPHIRKRLNIMTHTIIHEPSESSMIAVSHDANNTEGKNSHCVLFDEYHVHKTDDVKNSLRTGMAAREQPLFFIITTAGASKNGPCYQYRDGIINILDGHGSRENQFGIIYGIDKEDNWEDPSIWRKANPNYDVSVRPAFLQEEYEKALTNGRAQVDFKTKQLNVWVDADTVWIPSTKWDSLADASFVPPAGAVCYGGLDLASTKDICAFSLYFPEYNFFKRYMYVPEKTAEAARRSGIDYLDWVADGHLITTPGELINYEWLKKDIYQVAKHWDLQFIGYDQWNSSQIVQDLTHELGSTYVLTDKGGRYENKLNPFDQKIKAMSVPTKAYENMIVEGEMKHDGNPVMAWMIANVVLDRMEQASPVNEEDSTYIKPNKGKSKDKIDGVVADIMALGEFIAWDYILNNNKGVGVW